MLTSETKDLLHQLRSGRLDPASVGILAQVPAHEFLSDLRQIYPVVFQERSIGRKREIGLARTVRLEAKLADSLFPAVQLLPVLRRCLFVSSYDDSISEITATASVHMSPKWDLPHEVVVRIGRGFKLDRTPDGWTVSAIKHRTTVLSQEFLLRRGWKAEALIPFLARVS